MPLSADDGASIAAMQVELYFSSSDLPQPHRRNYCATVTDAVLSRQRAAGRATHAPHS